MTQLVIHSTQKTNRNSKLHNSLPHLNLPRANLFPFSVNFLGAFQMDHDIDYPSPDFSPFDGYTFAASTYVLEKATNNSVPIAAFAAGEKIDNFVVSSFWTCTKNNFTYDSGTGPTTVEVVSAMVVTNGKRSKFAQAFTLCMLLINWALTVASIYITVLVISEKEKMDSAFLLFPVTIVLTIPTLRGLYVGMPPFGIYIGKF